MCPLAMFSFWQAADVVWVNFGVEKPACCNLWGFTARGDGGNDGQRSENGVTGATGEMFMGTPRPGIRRAGLAITPAWQSRVHLLEIHEPPFPLQQPLGIPGHIY